MANTANYLNGIPLERLIAYFTALMKLTDIQHNDFDPKKYPTENSLIVDLIINDNILAECTNPKQTTFMNNDIMLNKLDYFQRKDPLHRLIWVLVVSFANFSKAVMERIKSLGIHLIILERRVTDFNYGKLIPNLFHSKLYQLLKRRTKPKNTKPTKLTEYIQVSNKLLSISNSSNSSIHNKQYLHQHSTDNAEIGFNPAVAFVWSKVRRKEPQKPFIVNAFVPP